MYNIEFKINRTDLSSRKIAAEFRKQVESALNNGENVLLDMSLVESISDSYSDELFGILSLQYGLGYFSDRIKIAGAKAYVLKTIAISIHRRQGKAAA